MSGVTTLYAPGLPTHPGAPVAVDGDGVRHLRAARLRPGAELRLTDGDGHLWTARLEAFDGRRARCMLLERIAAPADLDLELAFGVGSKQRTLWLVEKAVEIGVRGLQPIEFRRSGSVSDAARSPAFWERARRRAAAALTQCGGSRLPSLAAPCALEEYVARLASRQDGLRIALERDADGTLSALLTRGSVADGTIRLLVGPEGGLVPAERAACRAAGFRLATLGERVLRFETAAIVAAAAAGLIGEQQPPTAGRRGAPDRVEQQAS